MDTKGLTFVSFVSLVVIHRRREKLKTGLGKESGIGRRPLVHRAGARASRIAATAAGAHRPIRERFRGAARLGGEDRHQLLQIRALASRTRGRLAVACEVFEVLAAAAALVFKKGHGVF